MRDHRIAIESIAVTTALSSHDRCNAYHLPRSDCDGLLNNCSERVPPIRWARFPYRFTPPLPHSCVITMGYSSPYRSTRARSLNVIVGGVIASIGIVTGAMVTIPQYHASLILEEQPEEMNWATLAGRGLIDNAHVRLVDVAISPNGQIASLQASLDRLRQLHAIESLGGGKTPPHASRDQPDAERMIETTLVPAQVFPAGATPQDVPKTIMVQANLRALTAAEEEIAESGTLTGRVRMVRCSPAGDAADLSASGEQADTPLPEEKLDDETRYVFEPAPYLPSDEQAANWFYLDTLGIVVGLVLCGSGGPSYICCRIYHVPSLLSLLGFGLRYGRGDTTTRLIYSAAGLGLIYIGYERMFDVGHFGLLDGNEFQMCVGYLSLTAGCAALLGVATNIVATRFGSGLFESVEPRGKPLPKMTVAQACALMPSTEEQASRYFDPKLSHIQEQAAPTRVEPIISSLQATGFDPPHVFEVSNPARTVTAALQMGCQRMVIASSETDQTTTTTTRFVSVLEDGFVISTLSPGSDVQAGSRFGTNGLYHCGTTRDPSELLSTHLQRTAELAEKRGTAVVEFETDEWQDVYQYANRVLSDIRHQYGEINIEAQPARHGRFSFPPQAVPQLAGA